MDKKRLDKSILDVVKCSISKVFCKEWLESKPTGKFTVEVNINEGGVHGKPKLKISDTV